MAEEPGVITERDLLRQVASNLTKAHLIHNFNEKSARQGKELMEQNLLMVSKVWQAFEKFLHKQVVTKGKVADTMIVGLFRKHNDAVQFLPQPDYLDVGRFKLQKSLRGVKLTDSAVDGLLYKESYDNFMKVSWRHSLYGNRIQSKKLYKSRLVQLQR